jgi:hypothetical protein
MMRRKISHLKLHVCRRACEIEVSFSSFLSLAQLRDTLRGVVDGHVVLETLNIAEKYNGDRYYDCDNSDNEDEPPAPRLVGIELNPGPPSLNTSEPAPLDSPVAEESKQVSSPPSSSKNYLRNKKKREKKKAKAKEMKESDIEHVRFEVVLQEKDDAIGPTTKSFFELVKLRAQLTSRTMIHLIDKNTGEEWCEVEHDPENLCPNFIKIRDLLAHSEAKKEKPQSEAYITLTSGAIKALHVASPHFLLRPSNCSASETLTALIHKKRNDRKAMSVEKRRDEQLRLDTMTRSHKKAMINLHHNPSDLVGLALPRHRAISTAQLAQELEARETSMQIFVRHLDGVTFTFDVEPDDSVEMLQELIKFKIGINKHEQILTFVGKTLKTCRILSDYGIDANSTIHLSLALKGGSGEPPKSILKKVQFETKKEDDDTESEEDDLPLPVQKSTLKLAQELYAYIKDLGANEVKTDLFKMSLQLLLQVSRDHKLLQNVQQLEKLVDELEHERHDTESELQSKNEYIQLLQQEKWGKKKMNQLTPPTTQLPPQRRAATPEPRQQQQTASAAASKPFTPLLQQPQRTKTCQCKSALACSTELGRCGCMKDGLHCTPQCGCTHCYNPYNKK